MDANTMRARFLLKYEGARLGNRTFNDREISDFLTNGANLIIKERYADYKNRIRQGYGDSEIRDAELAGVISATSRYERPFTVNGVDYFTNGNNPFMIGTAYNGALKRPDMDNQITKGQEPDSHYGLYIAVPNEAMYIISEKADLYKQDCFRANVDVKEIDHLYYNKAIRDPYANPYHSLVWALDYGAYTTSTISRDGSIDNSTKNYSSTGAGTNMSGVNSDGEVVTINTDRARQIIPGKGWELVGYTLFYIKQPSNIVVDILVPSQQKNCDLADFLHEDVIDRAIALAAASIIPEQGKYQVNKQESVENQ